MTIAALDRGRDALYKGLDTVQQKAGVHYTPKGQGAAAVIAFVIGCGWGLGLALFFLSENWTAFGAYVCFLSFFHFSEFVLVSLFNVHDLTVESFLVNHSDEYTVAFIACVVEHVAELTFLPVIKNNWPITYLGILVTAIGMGFRITAMATAKHNFTHQVQDTKRPNHVLVKEGVYAFCRHPGYAGWFWYTVGTQILLFNPICIGGFAYAAILFFKDRIQDEEAKLVEFFGTEYEEYRKKTPTLIPTLK